MSRIKVGETAYRLDAVRDTLDFRDLLFTPTLVEVPASRPLEQYRQKGVPVLDQGKDGACTGFGLATSIHFLLRCRDNDDERVSARMLYELAKRYDEWPGEKYEGSSARGAMKGWHKHGVCSDALYPYHDRSLKLGASQWADARRRPLGAYFRVNHLDIVAMHAAITEVGVLYATATVHEGWSDVGADGQIEFSDHPIGGHAFAIVAYDATGLWIQNSWGPRWGLQGFGHITYDDWLTHGTDVWVARLGAPIVLAEFRSTAVALQPGSHSGASYAFPDLRPHIISTGNDGALRTSGTYGTDRHAVEHILTEDVPSITRDWRHRRLLLYAHGGLVPEQAAVQRVADYRSHLLEAQVYPIAFIWKTDFWTTLKYTLEDALSRRRPEGFLDGSKDFMFDRLDDALEPVSRMIGGKAAWDEMKENALRATASARDGLGGAGLAARLVADLLRKPPDGGPPFELHIVAHSAGSIYFARMVQLLTAGEDEDAFPDLEGVKGLGCTIGSVTLWAPAINRRLFDESYLPAVLDGRIERFRLYTLTDHAERDDDCARIYNKSLLYLVSNAFEEHPHIPRIREGEPIIGMERWVKKHAKLSELFRDGTADWVVAPNSDSVEGGRASQARAHGDFDDDEATVASTLASILGRKAAKVAARTPLHFERSASSRRAHRHVLMQSK